MPTKRLPAKPNLQHLKHQASDLLKDHRSGKLDACQRIREFHPRFGGATDAAIKSATFTLADAYLTIAREYGFPSWARLRTYIQEPNSASLDRPHHERIQDPVFRRAVAFLDDGDVGGLRDHIRSYPHVVRQRVVFEGENYFREPSLLEFVAENPIRHDGLPPNIVEVAQTILDEGGRGDQAAIDSTLELVCSGRVPRECGVQVPLINLLCDYGADPDSALPAALVHGEFEAVDALLLRGARMDLATAAATGRLEAVQRDLPAADPAQRHRAFALAAQHGHAEIVRLFLEAGEDPNRYNPVGCHAHSTPLHQAALAGHLNVVRALLEWGARLDIRDIHHDGTPPDWAEYAGQVGVLDYLRGLRHA